MLLFATDYRCTLQRAEDRATTTSTSPEVPVVAVAMHCCDRSCSFYVTRDMFNASNAESTNQIFLLTWRVTAIRDHLPT